MKLKPLEDRLLVLRIKEEEKTSGGIVIPDTAKEKPMQGKIIAVGPGKVDEKGKRIPMEVKKNDRVLFCGTPDHARRRYSCHCGKVRERGC